MQGHWNLDRMNQQHRLEKHDEAVIAAVHRQGAEYRQPECANDDILRYPTFLSV